MSYYLVKRGIGIEGNPLLSTTWVGTWSFVMAKVMMGALAVILLAHIYQKWEKTAFVTIFCGVFVYFGVLVWNVSLLVRF